MLFLRRVLITNQLFCDFISIHLTQFHTLFKRYHSVTTVPIDDQFYHYYFWKPERKKIIYISIQRTTCFIILSPSVSQIGHLKELGRLFWYLLCTYICMKKFIHSLSFSSFTSSLSISNLIKHGSAINILNNLEI